MELTDNNTSMMVFYHNNMVVISEQHIKVGDTLRNLKNIDRVSVYIRDRYIGSFSVNDRNAMLHNVKTITIEQYEKFGRIYTSIDVVIVEDKYR